MTTLPDLTSATTIADADLGIVRKDGETTDKKYAASVLKTYVLTGLDADDVDDTSTTHKFTTSSDITKLAGIETGADVTDETNVVAALNGATLTDVGTPASTDKILLLDTSDGGNLKYADFSEFAGGGGGGGINVPSRTGNYYYGLGYGRLQGTNQSITLDQLWGRPFVLLTESTFDRVGCRVTIADTAAEVRLGLYSMGTNGLPDALVHDFGFIDASSTGDKEITISQTIPAGSYFIAVLSSVTVSLATCAFTGGSGTNFLTGSGALYNTSEALAVYSSQAYGALPSTFGAIAGSSGAGSAVFGLGFRGA